MTRNRSIRDYLAERVDIRDMGHKTPCWVWKLKTGRGGYARSMMKAPELKIRFIHRVSYEEYVGPIPEGLTIDHLCRVPACCNPGHLEAVTIVENIRRAKGLKLKSHCKRGHAFTPDNIYINSQGYRGCLACKRYLGTKAWRLERQEAAA